MTLVRSLSTLWLVLLCTPDLAQAQSCFRGRPLPACRSFWIAESGIATRVNRNAFGQRDDLLGTLEVGRMRNRSDRTAMGGTVFVGVTDQVTGSRGVLLGVKPRLRRWIGGSTSVELSPGIFYAVKGRNVGLTGSAAINLGDWVALTGQAVALRDPASGTDVAWYVGGKIGARPTLVAAIVVPAIVALLVLTHAFPDES